MQRGQNSRTAGAVSYGAGFFGLVNIMQPQNCTTRLRRLVWTSFFLCVVFLFQLFCMCFFYHLGCWLREECIFSVAFKYNKLCVTSALLDNDLNVFILKFVHTSLQEDILWYHIVILFNTGPTCKVLEEYLDTCFVRLRRPTCGHNISGPRLHRIGDCAARQDF